jgi:acetoin utilization deacetylase AcuC-like enzyme
MPRVLLLTDPAMDAHAAPGHPERPERLGAVVDGVLDGTDAAGAELRRETPRPADAETIERVHPERFVSSLDALAVRGGAWIDADTYLAPDSMAAARLAAGGTVRAALAVAEGVAEVAFAVVRPPGHHAARERAAGFCLLNNIAIAAEALRAAGVGRRVAIVDWDVHHGDATQEIYDADPAICYASTHQSPLYPGTGAASERGSGQAAGTKHNVPLSPGSGDVAFVEAWRDRLLPAIESFTPDALLVSAGYDAHRDDPLAHLEVTEAGYREVAEGVGALARRLGIRGVALTLEGGYDLAALRRSTAETVRGLLAGLAG